MKKKLMLLSALVLSLLLVSCGGKKDDAPKTNAPAAATKQLSVSEYKTEVAKISKEIQDASASMQTINPGDPTAAMKVAKEVITKVTPLYEKLSALKAPDSLKNAQAKLKDGADASLELLKISSEMFEFASNPTAAGNADVVKKMQDLQAKMSDLQSKAVGMNEAMVEINAAN
ncbi:hypothetical protein [Fusobacterium sp. PH5-44]|uniref:hypothetical protein n=1 Tax=unclassified Fusobacterium TaxID=2648384 RepID=UPI003D1C7352